MNGTPDNQVYSKAIHNTPCLLKDGVRTRISHSVPEVTDSGRKDMKAKFNGIQFGRPRGQKHYKDTKWFPVDNGFPENIFDMTSCGIRMNCCIVHYQNFFMMKETRDD